MSNSNQAVANAWAKGKIARSSNGNLWSTGEILFSYRTPIASIVEGVNGERIALIDQTRYSVTTEGKHVNAAFRAMGYRHCYRVPFIHGSHVELGANLIFLRKQAEAEKARAERARVYKSLEHYERLVAQADEFQAVFGL